jgi:hypothetical protein
MLFVEIPFTGARNPHQRIGALHAIESEICGRSPDERREVRQTRARPRLNALHEWLQAKLGQLSTKSATTAAIGYALGRVYDHLDDQVPMLDRMFRRLVGYESMGYTIISSSRSDAASPPGR